MRSLRIFLWIVFILIIASCSKGKEENTGKEQRINTESSSSSSASIDVNNKSDASTDVNNESDIKGKDLEVKEISRKEAGLSTIKPLDFSMFSLNKRLEDLLAAPKLYRNSDYKDGIVLDKGLLINERFKGSIIADIKIGTEIDNAKKILGKPSYIDKDFVFYKTKEYYLGFKGTKKVEYAYLLKPSTTYNKNILKRIIEHLNSNKDNLAEAISNEELSSFFDRSGHIHGGGWYANSSCGIDIVQFDEDTITIYNNFEGTLYNVKNFNYEITYEDRDYEIINAINSINSYIWSNEEFNESGVLSPSGKLKSTFFWGHSQSHFFIIRTLDNSRPDFNVGAPAGEYKWLTDDYILYLNAWTSAPYIVKVCDSSMEYESVNIMYAVGVFKEDDYFQDYQFSFAIKDVNSNKITLYDEENKKEYQLEYNFDMNNKISFSLVK